MQSRRTLPRSIMHKGRFSDVMTSNWSASAVATWVWEIPYDRASAPGFNSGVSNTPAAVYRTR
jgi:hypothetical protein